MIQSHHRPTFVPVASGSQGHRGLHLATTRRLAELLERYKALRDDSANTRRERIYYTDLVREVRAELSRRQPEGETA